MFVCFVFTLKSFSYVRNRASYLSFITEAWGDFSSNLQKRNNKKKSVEQNLTAHVSYKTVF